MMRRDYTRWESRRFKKRRQGPEGGARPEERKTTQQHKHRHPKRSEAEKDKKGTSGLRSPETVGNGTSVRIVYIAEKKMRHIWDGQVGLNCEVRADTATK